MSVRDLNTKWVGVGVAVMVVLALVVMVWWGRDRTDYDRFIDAAWKGDPEYCKSAEISSMILVLDRPDGKVINGHLLINNDVCNQSVTLSVKKVLTKSSGVYELLCDVEFGEDETFDPVDVRFRFNLTTGQLRIYKDGELFGLLYRDNIVSAQTYE